MKTAMHAQNEFAFVESPHRGPDLLRKFMAVALRAGHLRRYFSLRRAWLRAVDGVLHQPKP